MDFGSYLKDQRKKQEMTLRRLSEALGCSSSYISSLENGRRAAPGYETLQKLAELLSMTESEKHLFYDLAAKSRKSYVIADDIADYINKTPEIRRLLRYSANRGLTNKDWKQISGYIKESF